MSSFSLGESRDTDTAAKRQELIDLARLLLTPSARIDTEHPDGTPRGTDDWVKARIRWHRLDGNNALADEMLGHENDVRRALGKDPLDA